MDPGDHGGTRAVEAEAILAGPILRRVDASEVTVWIATSSDPGSDAALRVLGGEGGAASGASLPVQTVRVGSRLFVSLLRWRPDSPLTPGSVHEYDLTVFGGKDLSRLGLLGPSGVGLAADVRPSFAVPADGQAVLHASCRKLHGRGEDAVSRLVALLRAEAGLPTRPAALFLTGDQIYADDVARDVLSRIIELSRRLGCVEALPDLPATPGPGRRSILEGGARFTSGKSDNHLLTLGEFAAMYLLAWSPVPWGPGCRGERAANVRSAVAFRRVLANVPTYMTFDDHEVTDDWYLDENWRNAVLATGLGRRVVENGLAAFWLFQAWGNDPERFGELLPRMKKLVAERCATGGDGSFLVDMQWHFLAPSKPHAVVVDTRTTRENVREHMELVGEAGFRALKRILRETREAGEHPLLVVSAAPVFGYPVIEFLQTRFAPLAGSVVLDFERWFERAFSRLLRLFRDAGVPEIVILSGDVHYGLNVRAEVLDRESHATELAIYQLVSSGLKNESAQLDKWYAILLRAAQNVWSALARNKVRGLRVKRAGEFSFGWRVEKLDEGRSPLRPWRRLMPNNNVGRVVIEDDAVVHELHSPAQKATAVVRMPRRVV